MLRKWVLFAFLSNFLLKSIDASTGEDCGIPREARGVNFFATIRNLFHNIKNLLFVKPGVTEEKRKNLKSAFSVFFDEMLRKKKVKDELEMDLRLGHHKLSSGYPRTSSEKSPKMSAEQLIAVHGYLSESHTVITEDGYMLTMQRVLPDVERISNRVVMLHHGILGSSEDWLFLGTYRALPYMLLEYGFDVWLLNARGNRYSRIHTTKSADQSEFWDFSWHEMGVYDLPATIKYISEITRSSELNFIGHSMGGTALLVLLSTMPQYNTILRSGTLLAPLAFMYHAKGPIKMLAKLYRENGRHALDFFGQSEFMRDEVFPPPIVDKYCKGPRRSCFNPLLLFGNGGSGPWGPKLLEDVMNNFPAGGSVKTIIHYVQLVQSGYFQMFHYDNANKQRKYRNNTPALYNLKGVTLPIVLFSSPSDWLSTGPDIQSLLPLLQDVIIHHVVKSNNFGHFDFVWSPDAPELIFNFILPLLDEMLPRRPKDRDYYYNPYKSK